MGNALTEISLNLGTLLLIFEWKSVVQILIVWKHTEHSSIISRLHINRIRESRNTYVILVGKYLGSQ